MEKQRYDLSNSFLIWGKDIPRKLPQDEWKAYCNTASLELARHKSKVIPETSEQLQAAVEEGTAIMMLDLVTKRLLGFAQIKKKSAEYLEFNSWMGLVPGVSRLILMGGAILGFDINRNARVLAKVREGNLAAEKVIKSMGGKLVGCETSEHHFNPDSLQPYSKSIFDISVSQLYPTAPVRKKLIYQSDNYQLALGI